MEAASSIMHGNTKKYDIPIDHLDFEYIKECTDVKELEKILKVLRTREEGFFPQLEQCCEDRLREFNPNSRVLRKDSRLCSKRDLELDERQQLDEDLKTWSSDMKNMEENIAEVTMETVDAEGELPPIRSGSITLTADGAKSSKPSNSNKRVMPRDYREWDKIDVDAELEKVDEDESKVKERTFIANKEVSNLSNVIDAKGLSEAEKLTKANREKDKGNEAFKSSDFKEAITYYSRSISLLPTAASYNNRALARLKCSQWHEAVEDTNTVLNIEPDNLKAMLRRGTAYNGLKMFDKARQDMNLVLSKEPNNKKAQDLLAEIDKEKQEKKKKGRRMKIEDVDGEEENLAKGDNPNITEQKSENKGDNSGKENVKGSNPVSGHKSESKGGNSENGQKKPGKQARRMKIEEVESDEDETEHQRTITNGNASKNEIAETRPDKVVNGNVGKSDHKPSVQEPVTENKTVKSDSIECNETNKLKKNENIKLDKGQTEASENATHLNDTNDKQVEEAADSGRNSPEAVNNDGKGENSGRNSPEAVDNDEKGENSDLSSEKSGASDSGDQSDTESDGNQEVKHIKRPVFYVTEIPPNCTSLKEEATALFKSGQYGEAVQKYSKVITVLEKAQDQIVNLSLMYSNRAACHLKTGDLPSAVRDCAASLELIPHSVKPLLRRASAYEHLERYNKAYIDYRHVLLLDSRVDQAHLGTKRCQQMLHHKDGPRWREKLQPPKVNPTEIPEIIGIDGKPSAPVVFANHPVSSQSKQSSAPSSQSQQSTTSKSQSQLSSAPSSQSKQSSSPNSQSQQSSASSSQSKQSSAPNSQSQQSSENLKQSSSQSNKPSNEKPKLTPQQKFDELKTEGNEYVKKSQFTEAITCYSQCDEVIPDQVVIYTNRALCYIRTNQADKAEVDCNKALDLEKDNVKALFRRAQARKMLKRYRDGIEDLNHLLKVDPKNSAAKKEMEVMKKYWREELEVMRECVDIKMKKEQKEKSKSAGSKHRKRMVIEEVENDEESTGDTTVKGSQPSTKSNPSKPCPQANNKSQTKMPSRKEDPTPTQKSSKSKLRGPAAPKASAVSATQGLPTVPKTAPKLDKATPYEFISAWNALKKAETVKPYYDLLKQIKPADIKTVISNKLDGSMLNVMTRCVSEHYIPNGETDESYAILKHLSTVPRFSTVVCMMSGKEKTDMKLILSKLEGQSSTAYKPEDIDTLKKSYNV